MSDPEIVKQIVTVGVGAVAGAVAGKEVTGALLGPAAKEVGDLGGRLVKMAFSPLRGMVWGYERIEDWLERELAPRLKGVPPEQIKPPAPEVVVPALMAVTYTQAEELRNLFANLLAKSMNTVTTDDVHPSFVEVIKQLTPDEVRILSALNEPADFYDIPEMVGTDAVFSGIRALTELYERAGCQNLDRVDVALYNLKRQNLVVFANLVDGATMVPVGNAWGGPGHTETTDFATPLALVRRSSVKAEVRAALDKLVATGHLNFVTIYRLHMTPYGRSFYDCCLSASAGTPKGL